MAKIALLLFVALCVLFIAEVHSVGPGDISKLASDGDFSACKAEIMKSSVCKKVMDKLGSLGDGGN